MSVVVGEQTYPYAPPVPVNGDRRRIANLRQHLHALLDEVIDEGLTVLGPRATALEAEIGRRWGGYAVTTSSGTDALQLALLAAGIGRGDEVIVPDMTFAATAFAVCAVGATPVVVDVEPGTWLLSPAAARAAITPRTRAIAPVHLYGQMADLDAILALARQHGLTVVEDVAQAQGATSAGRPAGSLGDFGCFSLWVGKNLGGLDDGGLVLTRTEEHRLAVERLHNLGRDRNDRGLHHTWGVKSRMGELNAAVIRHQLDRLPGWNRARAAIAAEYDAAFADLPLATPVTAPGREHVYYKYVVHSDRSGALTDHLAAAGVRTERVYPYLVSEQPALASRPHRIEPTPVARAYNPGLLCLPMFPELEEAEVAAVIAGVRSFFAAG